ncbi:response regulator [Luteolibacter soli]|uniref:histidine kinase n=1 Tax=Luteolibacter soli TaxID=3135280 RepID=A0ABU9ARL2_9BACT
MPNQPAPRPGLSSSPTSRQGRLPLYIGLAAAVLFFVLSGYNARRNTEALREGFQQVAHTHDVISALEKMVTLMKDAETGQRGFVISGDQDYLQPYHAARTALDSEMARLRDLVKDNTVQKRFLSDVEVLVEAKMKELAETIALRRDQGFDPARAMVMTNRGKLTMDDLRAKIASMEEEENRVRQQRIAEMENAHHIAISSGIATAMLGIVLAVSVTWLLRRAMIQRRHQEWLQAGRLELTEAISGERELHAMGEIILTFLTRYVGAHAGAFFARRDGQFKRTAMMGVPLNAGVPEKFDTGEGLLGRAVQEKTTLRIDDVPPNYLTVGSGLGQGTPRHLLIFPTSTDGLVNAVIELGFLHSLDGRQEEFLRQISEPVGVAVKSALYREHLQALLSETQQQAEELQAQGEELRVSNEELEEQGRALRESQARLEQQQIEMEQTNAQLEEQASTLEDQKEQLTRSKDALEIQARAVEQASRYKSDFLANMSHELRTPLNSSLILAKLLGDNRVGNLNEEQVKYARTIESAGNDLLELINDVLDLAKIEAGHMVIKPVTISPTELVASLRGTFDPIASQRSLHLTMEVAPGTPATFDTDSQRLEQVLKNLLSNALKFTEHGNVSLTVKPAGQGRIAFAVEDTGIGIAPEQQRLIFEPFQQADSTTERKYGGTGLGLSISRELTRLLGGEMTLISEPGKGSTFTVIIPEVHSGPRIVEVARLIPEPAPPATREPLVVVSRTTDDREALSDNARLILVVEDDQKFAQILVDLAHEMDFQCLVAPTAKDALKLAREHRPGAVLLDVGLPDDSGLLVLEQLKGDPRTRHIPVHVVSGSDYTQTAMALGAAGYMLKPVKREQLVEAFRQLEDRLTGKMQRVLVVEDDAVQADAMQKLLGSHDVETVAVRTAADCLEKLKGSTFDCMVLDLSLPDSSGFDLLETLSTEDIYSFPPVIVYTGRELDADEEQKLRRYSRSIIIKGAKSPERLLDEVSLFLHQVVADLPPEKQRIIVQSPNRDAALEGRQILIVEDDVRNIFALTSLLEGRGVKLQVARNGREALTALDRNHPPIDLVLMDVMMPEMDGFTAMREIRKRPELAKLPIIALTAKAMKDDQEQCLAAGANDYLSKPLDVEKLLSLIRVWMPR